MPRRYRTFNRFIAVLLGVLLSLLGGPLLYGKLPAVVGFRAQAAAGPGSTQAVPPALWVQADEGGNPETEAGEDANPVFSPLPDQPPASDAAAPMPGRPTAPLELPVPAQPPPSPRLPGANNADPADQIEPAVIELDARNRPINAVLSLLMQQELNNLIGRFESALLMANSVEAPLTLAVAATAPRSKAEAEAAEDSGNFLHPAIAKARQLLDDWDTLIANQDYAVARDRWGEVRDTLWDNIPAESPYAQAELRAIWLDRGTIVAARSAEGLAKVFDQLAAAGITTVFFETVNASFPIYPSKVAPQQNPLTRQWDPLEAAVSLAHQRGMTLHAWVWVFAAGNEQHNRLLHLPADYPGPVLALHPDWVGYDNRGNPIPPGQNKPFFDAANPEVRSYLTRLLSEIVSEYDVDGLHLDYIRYPFQDPGANRTYGYGQAARWKFRGATGVDPVTLSPRPDRDASPSTQERQQLLWDRWTDFRIQQVNSFVYSLAQTVKRRRPDLVLSAAVFAKPERERLQKIQQDWGTWAREGYIDWIVLMSYAEDTSRFEQLIQPWLVEEDLGSALVIPGIRLLYLSEAAALDQMQAARDLPTPGYALFATADLNQELTMVLQNIQGAGVNVSGSVEQPPYAMAANRFHSLQREWNWLLSQGKLWIEREQLIPWVDAVNSLGEDLQRLAETPSLRTLDQARTALAAVQAPLNEQILIDTANGRYRLQSWQHRLTTIEQLLKFGERAQHSTRGR